MNLILLDNVLHTVFILKRIFLKTNLQKVLSHHTGNILFSSFNRPLPSTDRTVNSLEIENSIIVKPFSQTDKYENSQ